MPGHEPASQHLLQGLRRAAQRLQQESDEALSRAIENVVDDGPTYGYRRVTHELRRRGIGADALPSGVGLERQRRRPSLCNTTLWTPNPFVATAAPESCLTVIEATPAGRLAGRHPHRPGMIA